MSPRGGAQPVVKPLVRLVPPFRLREHMIDTGVAGAMFQVKRQKRAAPMVGLKEVVERITPIRRKSVGWNVSFTGRDRPASGTSMWRAGRTTNHFGDGRKSLLPDFHIETRGLRCRTDGNHRRPLLMADDPRDASPGTCPTAPRMDRCLADVLPAGPYPPHRLPCVSGMPLAPRPAPARWPSRLPGSGRT